MRSAYAAEDAINGVRISDFGEEACEPAHSFGPAVRGYYLLHYVASGKGHLMADGRRWDVGPGQGFLICPGEITVYQADAADPWHYAWVGYCGEGAQALTSLAGMSRERRVFSAPVDAAWTALSQLRQDAASLRLGRLAALGGLCRFLALAAPEQDPRQTPGANRHYEKALWYMQGAYARNVSVQEIADFVGLSRSQLFRVFAAECGMAPKAVLQEMRLSQARVLLQGTDLSVEQVALSVGLSSATHLAQLYRARYGTSPRGKR